MVFKTTFFIRKFNEIFMYEIGLKSYLNLEMSTSDLLLQ
jgi:hypothetical protein